LLVGVNQPDRGIAGALGLDSQVGGEGGLAAAALLRADDDFFHENSFFLKNTFIKITGGGEERQMTNTNRKLVERLREGGNIKVALAALQRGEITYRQARHIVKTITSAKMIRERPAPMVVRDAAGRCIGEMVTRNRGASWIARRYGPNYPKDSAEFASQEGAIDFVSTGYKASDQSAFEGMT
jgi:hypothetical protein